MSTRTVTSLPVTKLPVGPQYNPSTQLGNWDTNRQPITKIIIHTAVGTVASATQRFENPSQNVSVHYGIELDGTISQWVEENKVAYQAGVYSINQSSIGIEHSDGSNYNAPRTDALYAASAALVHDICTFYGIPIDRQHIIKHSEVPYPTGCPDNLDIDRIVAQAKALASTLAPITPLSPTPSPPVDPNQVEVALPAPWGTMQVQTINSKLNDNARDLEIAQQQIAHLQPLATNFSTVAQHFAISPQNQSDPSLGAWIVNQINNHPEAVATLPPQISTQATAPSQVVLPQNSLPQQPSSLKAWLANLMAAFTGGNNGAI